MASKQHNYLKIQHKHTRIRPSVNYVITKMHFTNKDKLKVTCCTTDQISIMLSYEKFVCCSVIICITGMETIKWQTTAAYGCLVAGQSPLAWAWIPFTPDVFDTKALLQLWYATLYICYMPWPFSLLHCEFGSKTLCPSSIFHIVDIVCSTPQWLPTTVLLAESHTKHFRSNKVHPLDIISHQLCTHTRTHACARTHACTHTHTHTHLLESQMSYVSSIISQHVSNSYRQQWHQQLESGSAELDSSKHPLSAPLRVAPILYISHPSLSPSL